MSFPPTFFGWKANDLYDPETTAFSNAKIDWKETPDAYIFKVDTPGLKKEEVKVVIEEGKVLTISGERYKVNRGKKSSGKFLRSFRLPENASVDQSIGMENGVFTVTVPKVEEKKNL
ncbi:18.0 kDa class I heat shock protein-like [Telopea speciosissima]|uniref:18.0 kDa class I heat shock protein-like n=1 Tax=Telopea speciosissima TaxID=54955 RepID=UPI001CC5777C|nr:18.0 kDa class I heat shock protein-like [Telopea speciosissima]